MGAGRDPVTVAAPRRHARLAIGAAVSVLLLSGCVTAPGGADDGGEAAGRASVGVTHLGPEPTAMTRDGGVETWDLTVPPTVEAFGIDTDVPPGTPVFVGAYSSTSSGPRPVVFHLHGGTSVQVQATEVIFDARDSDAPLLDPVTGEVREAAGRLVTLSVLARTPEGAGPGVTAYRDVLGSLGLPDDSAVELEQRLTDADSVDPLESSEPVQVHASLPRVQGVAVGVSARFSPDDPERIAVDLTADWAPVPIP